MDHEHSHYTKSDRQLIEELEAENAALKAELAKVLAESCAVTGCWNR